MIPSPFKSATAVARIDDAVGADVGWHDLFGLLARAFDGGDGPVAVQRHVHGFAGVGGGQGVGAQRVAAAVREVGGAQ